MGGIRIKCLRCNITTGFEIFITKSSKGCPHCGKEWNYKNIGKTQFRMY